MGFDKHEDGEEPYYLPAIFVGCFEMHLSDGKETPDKKGFVPLVLHIFELYCVT